MFPTDVRIAPTAGYTFEMDYTNKKILVYWVDTTVDGAAQAQVADTTDLAALTGVRVVARGKYLQLGLVVPDIVGEQVPVEVNLRNMALRFSWRPDRTDAQSMPLDLGEVPSPVRGARNERRSPYQKLVKLMELAGPGKPPVAMRDTLGRDVYAHILGVEYEEVSYKTGAEPHLLAVVSYRVAEYS